MKKYEEKREDGGRDDKEVGINQPEPKEAFLDRKRKLTK